MGAHEQKMLEEKESKKKKKRAEAKIGRARTKNKKQFLPKYIFCHFCRQCLPKKIFSKGRLKKKKGQKRRCRNCVDKMEKKQMQKKHQISRRWKKKYPSPKNNKHEKK